MDDQISSAFKNSDVKIEDGFEFGDWRDQCITDKSYDELFSPRKSSYDSQNRIGWLHITVFTIHHEPIHSFNILSI